MIKNLNKGIFISIFVSFIILLFAFCFSVYLIKDKAHKVSDLNRQLVEARSENVLELKQNVQRLESEINQLDSYFVYNKDIVSFLEEIESLGRQVGILVEIQNVNITDITKSKKTEVNGKIENVEARTSGELSLTIQTKGDWSNIMAFVKILEKIDKKSSIEGLRLSTTIDPETKRSYWNALFNIKVLTD